MNSAPGRTRPRLVGGEGEQQVGLQRIGVLELVHEDEAEPLLELAPHLRVVAHEGAGAHQQVEKVERTGLLLALLVSLDARLQVVVHQGRQIGVGALAEVDEAATSASRASSSGCRADRRLYCAPLPLPCSRSRALAPSMHSRASQPS